MHENYYTKLMENKTILVTGSSGHLGRSIVKQFAGAGARLILADLKSNEETELEIQSYESMGINVEIFQVNLELQESRNELVNFVNNNYECLDVLINNAAFVGDSALNGWNTNFQSQSIETWRRALEVNLTSAFDLSKQLFEKLKMAEDPNIINIGSIYASNAPKMNLYKDLDMHNPAGYAASKAGLLQLTKWLAVNMAPTVRVNMISPGGILRNQPGVFVDRYSQSTPLARMATEKDVSNSVYFLSTPLASYITGIELKVDGGWSL
jgi:NAD(P)-dependent dehydrogenase (short-subunit alcohol dehydrogenase family)